MHRLLLLATTAFAVFACSRRADFRVPAGPDDSEGVLVAVKSGESIAVYGGPNVPFGLPLEVTDDDEVFVAYFMNTLTSQRIAAGELSVARIAIDPDGVLIPAFESGWTSVGRNDWRPAVGLPGHLMGRRLAERDVGCRQLKTGPLRVEVSPPSCTLVEPKITGAPAAPRRPDSVRPRCIDDRLRSGPSAVDLCAPWSPSEAVCGAQQIRSLPDGDCEAISRTNCSEPLMTDRQVATSAELVAALRSTPPGASIGLAPGDYFLGGTRLDGGHTLVGACASDVRLEIAALTIASDITIREIELVAPRIDVEVQTLFTVEDSIVEVEMGLHAADAIVEMDRVRLRTTTPAAAAVVQLTARTIATMNDVTITDSGDFGIVVSDGARLTSERVAIVDARSRMDGGSVVGGMGIFVDDAILSATDLVVERTEQTGILVWNRARATLRRAVVRNLGRPTPWPSAVGVHVGMGALLDAEDLSIVRPRLNGLVVETATATVKDVVIEEILADPNAPAYAFIVQSDARVDAQRVQVQRTNAQVVVQSSNMTLADFVFDGEHPPNTFQHTGALAAELGATLRVHRSYIRQAPLTAILAADPTTTVVVDDAIVEDVHFSPASPARALLVAQGAHLDVERALVRGAHGIGARLVDAGSTLRLANTRIESTVVEDDWGIRANFGEVTLDSVEVVGFRNHAVWLQDTSSDLSNVRVAVPEGAGGIALYSEGPSLPSVSLSRIAVVGVDTSTVQADIGRRGLLIRLVDLTKAEDILVHRFTGTGMYLEGTLPYELLRTTVSENRGVGIDIFRNTTVSFDNLYIRRTRPREGTLETTGLRLADVAAVVKNFVIEETVGAGIHLSLPASPEFQRFVRLENGILRMNRAALDVTVLEVERATTESVEVRDNETDIRTLN